jgi:protein-tyrosine phosphatase
VTSYFEECYLFIKQGLENGTVLIHCASGISRSTTFAIAYLMKEYNWSFEKSFSFVKSKREGTNPNFGFKKQLKSYESEINSRLLSIK